MNIEQRLSHIPPGFEHSVKIRDEIFYEVMGPNLRSRARTYGPGPSPYDVHDKKECESMQAKYREEVRQELSQEFGQRIGSLEAIIETLRTQYPTFPFGASSGATFIPSGSQQVQNISLI